MIDLLFNEGEDGGSPAEPETNSNFKTFESEDAWNKEMQSASSKAKNELLKSLSIKNVDDHKTQMEEFKKYKEEQLTESEKNEELLKSYQTKETQWDSQKSNYEAKIIALGLGIDPTKTDAFIAAAQTKVNDETDINQAMSLAKEEYGTSFTVSAIEEEKTPPAQFTPGTAGNKPNNIVADETARWRKEAGLK